MLNQYVLVGRVKELPELKETASGTKMARLSLEVDRNFPNAQGFYETDTVECTLWRGVAEQTSAHCAVDSVVGIKGRVQTRTLESKEGNSFLAYELVAEQVTFISTPRQELGI